MRVINELPTVGMVLYSVHEHYYYIPGRPASLMEYCVCDGKVTEIIKGGYTEIKVLGKNPGGYLTPYYFRASEIGKKVFCSYAEAVALAKQMTEDYEKRWGWLGEPEILMRRPWKENCHG